MSSAKYPRTYHLPWSPGVSSDDKVIETIHYLINTPIVITEKIDGGSCSMSRTDIFARSHSGPPKHSSFNIGKAIHASIKDKLPEGIDFFGEYVYAKHSIAYSELPGYFLLFGIRVDSFENPKVGLWKSWQGVKEWARHLNIPTVPELEKTEVSSAKELQDVVEKHMNQPSVYGGEREGVVVRRTEGFSDNSFDKAIAKSVRANHVTTSKHWANQKIIPNKLKINE